MPHAKCNLQADFVLEHVLIMWCIMFCKMFFMTSNVAESGSQAPNHEKFLRPAFITDWYFLGPCLESPPKHSVGPLPVRQLPDLLSLITVHPLK